MLGGSFWIALLRNTISAGLMLSFFLMLDRPKFPIRKTVRIYIIFGFLLITCYSIWYLVSYKSFIKIAPLSSLPVIGIFCSLISRESIYISIYKMAAGFYFFSVATFCGVDVAHWCFHGNLWIDILVRFLCTIMILIFTWKKLRKIFLDGVDFLIEEMDIFSSITLFISILLGAIVAYWPNLQGFSIFNMVRAAFTLFMAGIIQYTILHLYIHLGKEHLYQSEKELLKLNDQLLRQQLELMEESEKEAARIRHDIRHHILLIEESIQKGDMENLTSYIRQYGEDIAAKNENPVCANKTVNSVLSVYARQAKSKNINVSMNVRLPEGIMIRDIDWVAILANIFENAIHGCIYSKMPVQNIHLCISKKGNKIIIQCYNTSSENITFHKGLPVSANGRSMGVSSIIKTASRYDGQTDFVVKNREFITKILLNPPTPPPKSKEGIVLKHFTHIDTIKK